MPAFPTPDGRCPCDDRREDAAHRAGCDLVDATGRPVARTLTLRALRQELNVDLDTVAEDDQVVLLGGAADRVVVLGGYPTPAAARGAALAAHVGRRLSVVDLTDTACQANLVAVTPGGLADTQPTVALWGEETDRLEEFLGVAQPPGTAPRYLVEDLRDDHAGLPGGWQVWIEDLTCPDGYRPAGTAMELDDHDPAVGDPRRVLLIS